MGEVAEEIGMLTRTYSLEEMGLRSDRGRLTDEGAAFIALLRAGGSLPRRSDDMTVLSLAKRLSQWTGLDDEPLTRSGSSCRARASRSIPSKTRSST